MVWGKGPIDQVGGGDDCCNCPPLGRGSNFGGMGRRHTTSYDVGFPWITIMRVIVVRTYQVNTARDRTLECNSLLMALDNAPWSLRIESRYAKHNSIEYDYQCLCLRIIVFNAISH